MFDIIAGPMGKILYFIYNNMAYMSYGVAIIIFTILVKIALLPLMIKQYHSTAKMQELGPKIQEIQKMYKNDKEKMQIETMKVYKDNNVNPAGGCLPILIQMPILIALWQVITKPLTYMLDMKDKIQPLAKAFNVPTKSGYPEIKIITDFVSSKAQGIIDSDISSVIEKMREGFDFLGINLGMTPFTDYKHNFLLLLIPAIAFGTGWFSTKLSTKISSASTQSMDNPMMKSMMIMGPMMTLFFSFTFPAGMGLYWIVGNIFQIFQQLFINKLILKKKEVQISNVE